MCVFRDHTFGQSSHTEGGVPSLLSGIYSLTFRCWSHSEPFPLVIEAGEAEVSIYVSPMAPSGTCPQAKAVNLELTSAIPSQRSAPRCREFVALPYGSPVVWHVLLRICSCHWWEGWLPSAEAEPSPWFSKDILSTKLPLAGGLVWLTAHHYGTSEQQLLFVCLFLKYTFIDF